MSTTKHTMTELRGHLFDTIEQLKDPEGIDTRRADSICKAAGRLIQTAEIEIKYRQLVARAESDKPSLFLSDQS